MYYVMYDRHLKSIGETYILESWSRIRRSMDLDEVKISGEQIPYSAEPFIVVVNDPQGRQVFSGLASTPVINEKTKTTSISLKDYRTLFNSEIVIDWGKLNQDGLTLSEYVEFILTLWLEQCDVGFSNIKWETKFIADILWDPNITLGEGFESVSIQTLIKDLGSLYGVYASPELDVYRKTLTFTFHPTGITKFSIRLKDFGTPLVEKSFGEYNRVTVYNHLYEKQQEWALTESNSVVMLPSTSKLVYPAKNRNFIAEDPDDDLTETQALLNAIYDAVAGLASNRYQENIDLDLQQYSAVQDISFLDFSYMVSVYAENGFYKDLPVGEIETDNNGKHIIRLGQRIQELTQEI